MDLYPLFNSLRIALLGSILIFFIGVFLAWETMKLGKILKGIVDVILTLPLVLPPTVSGYFLLKIFGPRRPVGMFLDRLGITFVMTWQGGVLAAFIVAFPLMYRAARGAFESFDEDIAGAARTLGLKENYIFWKIRMPYCRHGLIAGLILSFARALGEYGATTMLIGYIPGRTATVSTTVYQLWRTDNDILAMKWVIINIFISAAALIILNIIESGKEHR